MAVAAEKLRSPADGPGTEFDKLLAARRDHDAPEGFKMEISEGAIVMVPPPGGRHSKDSWFLNRVLTARVPEGAGLFQHLGLVFRGREQLFIPDLVLVTLDEVREDGTAAAENAHFVCEITSPSNARRDREDKLASYAAAAIPLYLLVDQARKHPTVTLHSDPVDGEYQRTVTVPFGDPIHLPAPFDVDLDTSDFPR